MNLDELWNLSQLTTPTPSRASNVSPGAALRYCRHSLAAPAIPAYTVRLKMHGEIKLKGWYPFTAEQVICWNRGMIWQASVRCFGISISGSDSYVNEQGASVWKVLGLIPVANVSGPDVTRSAAGRANIESIWLPSALCSDEVTWTSEGSYQVLRFTAYNEAAEMQCAFADSGALKSVMMPRWGNPGSPEYRYESFGAYVEEEKTFGGYTIPSRVRVGWYFGTPRFEQEGEFFRATLDSAVYR